MKKPRKYLHNLISVNINRLVNYDGSFEYQFDGNTLSLVPESHGKRCSNLARQATAAFPRFPTRKLFVDMPRRLDVPLQWFVGHFPVLCDFVTLSMTATRSNAPER